MTSSAAWSARVLGLVGAAVGYGYGAAANSEVAWLYALAGALAGVFVLDALAFAYKVVKVVVLTAVTLVCVAVALYVLARLIGN